MWSAKKLVMLNVIRNFLPLFEVLDLKENEWNGPASSGINGRRMGKWRKWASSLIRSVRRKKKRSNDPIRIDLILIIPDDPIDNPENLFWSEIERAMDLNRSLFYRSYTNRNGSPWHKHSNLRGRFFQRQIQSECLFLFFFNNSRNLHGTDIITFRLWLHDSATKMVSPSFKWSMASTLLSRKSISPHAM